MKKKDIKIYFKAIRSVDLQKVKDLVTEDKNYLLACNFAPPKKDDGQSGLQVAFKVGAFDIAHYLIEQGADVNFQEQSEVNEWTTPVLQDCIRAVAFNTYTMKKDTEQFDKALLLLQLMLDKGANPNATDSYGNNCLNRALLDANVMINHPAFDKTNPVTVLQMRRVFKALINARADVNARNEQRESVLWNIKNFRLDEYELL